MKSTNRSNNHNRNPNPKQHKHQIQNTQLIKSKSRTPKSTQIPKYHTMPTQETKQSKQTHKIPKAICNENPNQIQLPNQHLILISKPENRTNKPSNPPNQNFKSNPNPGNTITVRTQTQIAQNVNPYKPYRVLNNTL